MFLTILRWIFKNQGFGRHFVSRAQSIGPGDRTPATEIQSGQSSTNPHNPFSCYPTPPTISNTHCTCHTYLTMKSLIDMKEDTCTLTTSPTVNLAETFRSLELSQTTLDPLQLQGLRGVADPTFWPLNRDHRDKFSPTDNNDPQGSIVQQQKSKNTPPTIANKPPRKQDWHQCHK